MRYASLLVTALAIGCATAPDPVSHYDSMHRLAPKASCGTGISKRTAICVTDLEGFLTYHKAPDLPFPGSGVARHEFIESYAQLITDLDSLRYSIAGSEEESGAHSPLSGTMLTGRELAALRASLSQKFDVLDVNRDGSIDKKDDCNRDNMITREDLFERI